ncbi:TPA: hypothetical protein I9Z65_000524 [Clostridium perfringens]|nr:hypothetical protein [Clostridium perfringens]HBC2032340.1 hypothetical protein [Clostridium perfringens]HBC2056075.1 hypothetical protein [Clostridium perfringens]HBC2069690.1 hypothetical protein [Clostridium perfringens]
MDSNNRKAFIEVGAEFSILGVRKIIEESKNTKIDIELLLETQKAMFELIDILMQVDADEKLVYKIFDLMEEINQIVVKELINIQER